MLLLCGCVKNLYVRFYVQYGNLVCSMAVSWEFLIGQRNWQLSVFSHSGTIIMHAYIKLTINNMRCQGFSDKIVSGVKRKSSHPRFSRHKPVFQKAIAGLLGVGPVIQGPLGYAAVCALQVERRARVLLCNCRCALDLQPACNTLVVWPLMAASAWGNRPSNLPTVHLLIILDAETTFTRNVNVKILTTRLYAGRELIGLCEPRRLSNICNANGRLFFISHSYQQSVSI